MSIFKPVPSKRELKIYAALVEKREQVARLKVVLLDCYQALRCYAVSEDWANTMRAKIQEALDE